MSRPTVLERARQTGRLFRNEGREGIWARLRSRASRWLMPEGEGDWRLRVARSDLVRAAEIASSGRPLPPPLPRGVDQPLKIAWVTVPPGGGGGGFTTLSRLAAALEQAGHKCVIYLHDRHGWDMARHRQTIREWWPALRAEIRSAADGIDDAHAIFATSWETAYPVLTSPAKGARMYLVQDFEPWFYPAGTEALLAEATYRFGFHGVTAGRWLAERLSREYGMAADYFEFGCDLDHYRLEMSSERTGVCFYARPSTTRRAFAMGVAALDMFAERHGDVDIHVFGERTPKLPFAASVHGTVTPSELNRVYNRCVAGLSLSATNVSLVPLEMLAAGCIPVVNDGPQNRVVLDNPQVVYARATPFDLANALSELVSRPASARLIGARVASASVEGASWSDAGVAAERIISDAVGQASRALALAG